MSREEVFIDNKASDDVVDNDAVYSEFAYDDAFHTMVVKCDNLLIPFINHMFDEHYTSAVKIDRGANEHFIDGEDGSQEKRISDSIFKMSEGGVLHSYHIECESKNDTDGSIIVRMFEYDTQIALERGEVNRHRLDVYFPHAGILFLRSSDDMPDEMTVTLHTSAGDLSYPIRTIKIRDYTLDMIFENELYFLLPFYAFNFEKDFKEIEADEIKQKEFLDVYREIFDKLGESVDRGELSVYYRSVIIRLVYRVTYKLLMKQKKTQKKVGEFMGGKVIELDVIKAHDAGIEQGRMEGRREAEKKVRAEEAKRKELEAENNRLREEIKKLKLASL